MPDRRRFKALGDRADELLCSGSLQQHDQARIGAELTCAEQATATELLGNLVSPLLNCTGQDDDGIDTGEFQVDELAGAIGGCLEAQPGRSAAGVGGGTDAWIGHEPFTVLMAEPVNQLDGTLRHTGLDRCLVCFLRKQLRGAGVRRIGFGEHRVARGDGGREIPARNAVEGERKIVGTENAYRPERCMAGADVELCVERG